MTCALFCGFGQLSLDFKVNSVRSLTGQLLKGYVVSLHVKLLPVVCHSISLLLLNMLMELIEDIKEMVVCN